MERFFIGAAFILCLLAAFLIVGTIDYEAAVDMEREAPVVVAPVSRRPNDPTRAPETGCSVIALQWFATRSDGGPWRIRCVMARVSLTSRG
jgi:hypothetical protein